MEVVLADGDVLRTGMGAMENNKAWHLYRRGMGPTPDQMFMQSNVGIVTKMGVWLVPEPEIYMPLWLRVWNDDDIGPMLDILRELMMDDTIRMVPQIMSTILMGSVFTGRDQWYTGEGAIPDEIVDRMAREMEAGRWLMRFALFGDEAVVDHRSAKIKKAFESRIPRAEVWGTKVAPDQIAELQRPSEKVGGGVPDYIAAWIPLRRAAYDVSRRLVAAAGKLGYGGYRAHLDFMDLAADQYAFNDHAQRRFNEKIKDCLDPNGILSPGKQGIWPSGLRNQRPL